MKIKLTQATDAGRKDDWSAEAEGLSRKGIGHTEADAFWSLVRANLDAFGITGIETETIAKDEEGVVGRNRFVWPTPH